MEKQSLEIPIVFVHLPLFGDVKHQYHTIAVLIHVQKLSIQGQFTLRLLTAQETFPGKHSNSPLLVIFNLIFKIITINLPLEVHFPTSSFHLSFSPFL